MLTTVSPNQVAMCRRFRFDPSALLFCRRASNVIPFLLEVPNPNEGVTLAMMSMICLVTTTSQRIVMPTRIGHEDSQFPAQRER
jgi:hypothetical protein